jgi:DNA-directed RNA polymerase specialized sigma24 family protein
LRFYCDYTEAQAADALGCSVGNVKSLTSRGVQRLRAELLPNTNPSARNSFVR